MQTNSTRQKFAALPDAAVERLFARLAAMYGDGAMKRMWGQQDADAVKGIWAQALGRFDLPEIGAGLHALDAAGNTFPPTLPEFVALCSRKPGAVPLAHRKLLPVPDRTAEEIAAGAEQMARIRQMLRGSVKRVPA